MRRTFALLNAAASLPLTWHLRLLRKDVAGISTTPSNRGHILVIAMVAFCVDITLLPTVLVDQIYWMQMFLLIDNTPWGVI